MYIFILVSGVQDEEKSVTFLAISATVQRKSKCNKMQLSLLKSGQWVRKVE